MSLNEPIAEVLAKVVGPEKAREVLRNNPAITSDEDFAQALLDEPLSTSQKANSLFTRISEAMLATRDLASGISTHSESAPYLNALFAKTELNQQRVSEHLKTAQHILIDYFKIEETISLDLQKALVRDLAIFLALIEGFLDFKIKTSFDKGDKNNRQVALSLSTDSTFSFNPDTLKIFIPMQDIAALYESLEAKSPDQAFTTWVTFKAGFISECIHAFQLLDSELFFNLSTTLWYILKEKIMTELELEAEMSDFISPAIIDEMYMRLPHEAEASVAQAFIEHSQLQIKEEKASSIDSIYKCANLLDVIRLEIEIKKQKSDIGDVDLVADFLVQLANIRNSVIICSQPTLISFGFKPKQEYVITPVDILGFREQENILEAVTLVKLTQLFEFQKKEGLRLLSLVSKRSKGAKDEVEISQKIPELKARFQQLLIS